MYMYIDICDMYKYHTYKYIYIYIYTYGIHPSVMNTICINSFGYTHVITSTRFRLKTNVATGEGNSRNEM